MIRCYLSNFMGEKKYTMTDVCNATGLSKITISGLYHERAKRVDLATLEKLCKLFNCSIGELLEYIPEEE